MSVFTARMVTVEYTILYHVCFIIPTGPIPVPLFPQHVSTLHADGDIGFSKEYEAIQSVSFQGELNSEHSMNEDNKNKNRYLNIVACK